MNASIAQFPKPEPSRDSISEARRIVASVGGAQIEALEGALIQAKARGG